MRVIRWLYGPLLLLLGALVVPWWWSGREANRWLDGDAELQLALAREVAAQVRSGVDQGDFHTVDTLFDAEWALGTHQMAVLGLARVIRAHPETREELLPVLELAAERLVQPDIRRFGTEAWGDDGLDDPDPSHGHAYLGYLNLALGALREVHPDTELAPVHDRLSALLAQRVAATGAVNPSTYPGETYPPDIASVLGSLALHARLTGGDEAQVQAWIEEFLDRYQDPDSGLLYQSISTAGRPWDEPRGSGTAIAAYFFSFADQEASARLYRALAEHRSSLVGYGGIREYPRGTFGLGDVDSGPVLLGVGVSSTGFTLASARIHGDRGTFTRLYRTAWLFGAPVDRGGRRSYVSGGPLGNAIMLAMLTASSPVADGFIPSEGDEP